MPDADHPPHYRQIADTNAAFALVQQLVPPAVAGAGLNVPCPEGERDRAKRFCLALSLLLTDELDLAQRQWETCGLKTTDNELDLLDGPPRALLDRIDQRQKYEETNDFAVFTVGETEPGKHEARSYGWPLVSAESETACWWSVDDWWLDPVNKTGPNDYLWDFYKLIWRRTPTMLFTARVCSRRGVEAPTGRTADRIRRLGDCLNLKGLHDFAHIVPTGHYTFAVVIPGSQVSDKLYIGAAVAPDLMRWKWISTTTGEGVTSPT